jgi:hypothetical protein
MAMHHDGWNPYGLHQKARLSERIAALQPQPLLFRRLSLLPRKSVISGD